MSGAVAAIATAASAAAETAAGPALGFAAGHFIGVAVYAATSFTLTAGALYGLSVALQPKLPSPQALQTPLKQPMPVRQSAFGTVLVAGAYALFTAANGVSYNVHALLDGQSNRIVGFRLNDDTMAKTASGNFWWAPGAPGKYGGGGSREPNLVRIDFRLGLPTETAYAISGEVPIWDANHRGDGVTSMLIRAKQAKREDQAGDFPNGDPQGSAIVEAQLIFDPRDPDQVQADKSTYKFSKNPIWVLLAYMTDAEGGIGLDYARFILPAIDLWKAAADECDGLVSTAGMHATLSAAAAAGDHKVFLNDTTGLTVGASLQLTTETVTVSALPGGGEVDLTGALAYAHGEGELSKWDATGQKSRYECSGTYRHDTAPGDVIASILATFDGWMMQRGDGAFVVRTNTLYAPTVVLTDRHIVGYQIDEYELDEAAVNQFIGSYTDPASAYNEAEAGYVQDDRDIAARGQEKSSKLAIPWCPSGPQCIAVLRAVLARSTQDTRGTITCNLAGLAVAGERYVGVQIGDFPALGDAIVEVVGDLNDDPKTMTVSFPFVLAGAAATASPSAICFIIDASVFTDDGANAQSAIATALNMIGAHYGSGIVDICAIAFGTINNSHTITSITRRAASAGDIAAVNAWVQALAITPRIAYPSDAFTAAKTFFDGTDASILIREMFVFSDGAYTATLATNAAEAAACAATLATMTGVQSYAFGMNIHGPGEPDHLAPLDNTPADGVPSFTSAAVVTPFIETALFGTTSTPGSSYTLPSLAPPSGSPLQPLAAPTIASVTPDYADSGGGISGARLAIEVDDPGGNITWKVRWKLSADTLWTEDGGPITADPGPPLTILTGFVPATGTLDVEVAYATASQVSDWSATAPVTVAAPLAGTASPTAAAALVIGPGYMYDDAGTAKVVNADAASADPTGGSYKPCNCWITAVTALGAPVTVIMPGQYVAKAGLSPGATYWLVVGGGVTNAAPAAAGNLDQVLGTADDTGTKLFFAPQRGAGVV